MGSLQMFPNARIARRRPSAPQLRLKLIVYLEILFAALEHKGARVSDGRWIEPLRHHAYPRQTNRKYHQEA